MDVNRALNIQNENLEDEYTFVFDVKEAEMPTSFNPFKSRIWQIIPSICGCTICIPFGLMLGWPSPMNPILLSEQSPIPITLDQSAMIAGFLMLGNSAGVLISIQRYLSPKNGLILTSLAMCLGFLILWKAVDIYYLLGSRFLVGLANGYGTNQVKTYIVEMADEDLRPILVKLINLCIICSLILSFILGAFVDFYRYGIICFIISIFILFILIFLPPTPKDLIKTNEIGKARELLKFLRPHSDCTYEIDKIRQSLNLEYSTNFCALICDPELRIKFAIFSFLIFCAQWSGVPATMVYCQFLLDKVRCPYPQFAAILYVLVYFFTVLYTTYFISFNKKTLLLISSVATSLLLSIMISVLYTSTNEVYQYLFLCLLMLYLIIHTIGLGCVPITLIDEWFPQECKSSLNNIFVIFFSIMALVITKIFQVLIGNFELYTPFFLFLSVSLVSSIFVAVFYPNYENVKK